MPAMTAATVTLWRREMVRFFRQRSRVLGALATPILFYAVLGFGLDEAFRSATTDGEHRLGYLAYFFTGVVVMILLFTAIFSTITVIEDRREGLLQAVLVSPVPRKAIVMAKVLGGATVAVVQGAIFLLAWPFVLGHWPGLLQIAAAIAVMVVLAVALVALGLSLAWPMDSAAAFHGVMTLFLMPMWLLCGAVFPMATAPIWMQAIMWANPLTYGYVVLAAILGGAEAPRSPVPLMAAVPVMLVVTVVMVLTAIAIASRTRKDGT